VFQVMKVIVAFQRKPERMEAVEQIKQIVDQAL
jgi:hypothetical protein